MKHIKLFEQFVTEGKGRDEAQKIINKLRSTTFKKLNDEELEEFRKEMAMALDLKESAVIESTPSKEDLRAYINKNREEIDHLVDNDAWDKVYMMVLNDFTIEPETPEGESVIKLFNEVY